MSDLQLALIIIGTLIIGGVIVFNWWQERKFRQQMESSFFIAKSDALFDDPKINVENLNIKDDASTAFSLSNPTNDEMVIIEQHEIDTLTVNQPFTVTEDSQLFEAEIAAVEALATETDPVPSGLLDQMKQKTQHADIKTIFNEAFSQSAKLASETASMQATTISTAESLQTARHESSIQKVPVQIEPAFETQAFTLAITLDAQIDLIAVLYLAKETAANTLYDAFLSLIGNYDKTVFVHVLDDNYHWHSLTDTATDPALSGLQTTKLSCSLQLADRAGAISRNTLNRFQLAVETLGLDINAHVAWQTNGDILTAANALDAFCIEVDKTIALSLLHGDGGPFTGTKLRGIAEAQGFTLAADGLFKYYGDKALLDGHVLTPAFTMFNADNYPFSNEMLRNAVIKGITFQLDIPHVKNCAEAYSQMVQIAQKMSVSLNAVLMAANNKVLGDVQIEKTRQQLQVIHATMLTRGIVPGSPCALRLFS